jgi:hypothetical protein
MSKDLDQDDSEYSGSYSDSDMGSDSETESETLLDNDEGTADLDDIDLLKNCSREDLFMLIKEDPKYYLDLIKNNQLENELSILVRRSDDGGGLYIKFRIYPEDRWTEVGYWDSRDDDEVYSDFTDQIKILLTQSRSGRQTAKYNHLGSQLDGNNNVLSDNYGQDIQKLKNDAKNMFSNPIALNNKQTATGIAGEMKGVVGGMKRLNANNLKEMDRINQAKNAINDQSHLIDFSDGGKRMKGKMKDCVTCTKFDSDYDSNSKIEEFKGELIEKIIKKVPELLQIQERNYGNIIRGLSDLNLQCNLMPENYKIEHNRLLEKIKGCQYIQRVHSMTDWKSYPELYDYLVDFHREGMKQNPTLYQFSSETLENLLDQDDKAILKLYVMNIGQIWSEYLNEPE